jgi:hypothetical protein
MKFKKGDIIWGKFGTDARHPIVFYANIDDDLFEGFMLTKSPDGDNISIREEFIEKIVNGINKPFRYNNTHVVNARLLKKWEWKPFRKHGELTADGIALLEAIRNGKELEFWEDYESKKII